MKLFNIIKKRIILFISIIICFMVIPYSIVDLAIKPVHDTYNVNVHYNQEVDYNSLISFESLEKTKEEIISIRQEAIDSGQKAPYSDFSYVKIEEMSKKENISVKENDTFYTISVSKKYFNSLPQARRFLTTLANNEEVIGSAQPTFEETICYLNEINNYIVLGYSFLGAFLLTLLIFILLLKIKPSLFDDNITYDNKKVYKTPFHIGYWISSTKEVKTVKKMVLLSILFALQLCTKFISIPSGFSNLGLSLGYLIFSVIAMIYGPIVGLFIGFGSDILGYVIRPDGVFFMGYTLSAMLAGFTYGICFYKTKITFTKCLFARLIVNMIINTLIGSVWWWLISDKSFSLSTYILITALPKNLVYLIPQSLLLYYFIKMLSRILKTNKVVDDTICDNITFI